MRFKHILLAATAATLTAPAFADDVSADDDFIQTLDGTWFDFGGPIGIVNFLGNPFDGNLWDTVIRRLDDVNFPTQGGNPWDGSPLDGTFDTIDIELVVLELRGIEPIDIGGLLFDVTLSLDSDISSLGSMTLQHEWNDDGLFQGTFDSSINVFADALFTPVAGGPGALSVDIDNLELSSAGTFWWHGGGDGFQFDIIQEAHPGVGVHRGRWVTPAPGGAVVLVMSCGILAGRRRRQCPRR